MLNLLLIGLSCSFFLAVLDPALDFIANFIGGRASQTFASLLIATLSTWLAGNFGVKQFVLYTVAGAFLGVFLYTLVEKIAKYKVTVYQS